MKKFLPLAFILLGIHATAQIRSFSIELSANYPLIRDSKQHIVTTIPMPGTSGYFYHTSYSSVKETYEGRPGIDFRGSTDIGISDKFFITTGLSASYIRYKRNGAVGLFTSNGGLTPQPSSEIPSGRPIGTFYGYTSDGNIVMRIESTDDGKKLGETTALYLDVPVMAGTSVWRNKVDIRAGFVGSWLVQATEYRARISPERVVDQYKEKNPGTLNSIQTGAMIQATYRISSSIGIDLTGRKYFNAIYKDNDWTYDRTPRYNMISLGMRYTFNLTP